MDTKLSDRITLAPAKWPEGKPEAEPGDLTLFVPNGLGLAAPLIMGPHDRLEDAFKRRDFYGFTAPSANPLLNAPLNDDKGGVVYLHGYLKREELQSLLSLMGGSDRTREYAAFWSKSENVQTDRYVEQLRIVPKGAIQSLFRAPAEKAGAELIKQQLTVEEALWAFVEDQQARYDSSALTGCLGGDGDWAKERLAFGLMVENSYWGVCRIWSRAWLITK